jgi:hypothetical protein
MLSVATGITITSSMYTVLGIRATTNADLPGSGGMNSKARVNMVSTATQQGYVDVFYNRLDLGQLANYSPIKSNVAAGLDLFSTTVINAIRDMYGIQFTSADLQDATTVDDGTGTGASMITLTALPGSLGWLNSVTIHFAPLPNISTAFVSPIMPGF